MSNQLDKMAALCADAVLDKSAERNTKEAWIIPALLGLTALGGGWAYHNNAVRKSYTQGNRDLMTELRPLLAGLNAPRGGFDLK